MFGTRVPRAYIPYEYYHPTSRMYSLYYMLWEYPGIYLSMTKTNYVRYPCTQSICPTTTLLLIVGYLVYTLGVPGHLPEYDRNN